MDLAFNQQNAGLQCTVFQLLAGNKEAQGKVETYIASNVCDGWGRCSKNGQFRPLFLFVFSTVNSKLMFCIKFCQ